MPTRRTHSLATAITAGLLTAAAPAAAHVLGLDMLDALGAPLGALAGLVIDPDLDLAENRRVGIWSAVWLAYGKMASHRGVSHWPVAGTILRLAYLLAGPLVLLLLAGQDPGAWLSWVWGWHVVRWALVGLVVADLVHIGMDAVSEWV
jgi:uncharacterized metal-binding protein